MKNKTLLFCSLLLLLISVSCNTGTYSGKTTNTPYAHYGNLFLPDLSNAVYDKGVWTFKNGILTANEDKVIFSDNEYENFTLELDFMNEPGANSGVLVYCSDRDNWIPNSVEIQITDDFSEKWANADPTWQCGAIFGHLAPTHSAVKEPGKWNHYRITCKGKNITVELNGDTVTMMDMSLWTSAKINPDGTKIPDWLSTPFSVLPTKGFIGLQGKHAGAKVYFKNINIKTSD
ncbi:MAG: DUF1080 domain-containing protein [Chlorobi bacterium]|nr:DUF1080 domain-containing protein [Chlorobiota bacterium]